jgi:4-amino-4-deoxy-L-arabinose transferase-like glycosyltransferase
MRHTLLLLVLFLAVWLPRLLTPSPFVGADEPAWAYRSLRFLQGLLEGDLAQTFQAGHPGVLTMWAGAVGAVAYCAGRGEPLEMAVADLPVLPRGEFAPYDLALLRRVSPILPAACVVTATFNSLLLLVILLLLWFTFDRGTALLALGLLAFDPFHLAMSRQLHPEALPALAMLLSWLALLAFFKTARRRALILSGMAAGWAVLDKTYALFLIPCVGLMMGWHIGSRDAPASTVHLLRRWAKDAILWGAAMTVTIFALWPALWVKPLTVAQEMLQMGLSAVQGAETPTTQYFLGQIGAEVGAAFYPVAMLFRATPLTAVGFIVALVTLVLTIRESSEGVRFGRYLLGFVVLFVAFLSWSSKKFPRYALTALLTLDLLAALSWRALYEKLRWQWRRWLWAAAVVLQVGFVLSFHPHYLAHYNLLVGGLRQAIHVLPVGGGEGTELAADYLAAKDDAANLRVATWSVPSLAPYFPGDLVPPQSPHWQTANYVLVYIGDTQEQTLPEVNFPSLELERTFQMRGLDYVWLYRNRYYQDPLREIEAGVQAEDTLFLDVPSVLTKHLPAAVRAHVLSGDENEAEIIAALSEVHRRSRQIWLLTHPGSQMTRWLPRQLETHALLVNEWALPGCQLALYHLLPDTSFGQARPTPLEVPSPVRFDDNLDLTALDLTEEAVEYRQKLGVVLGWQAIAENRPAYAVSLRLVDETGYRWAQTDTTLKALDGRSTDAWSRGERASTWHLLRIPAGIPPGPYLLVLVPQIDGGPQAVEIRDGAGQSLDREMTLADVTVRSATLPPNDDELPVASDVADSGAELGELRVLGYDLAVAELAAAPVPLTVCWQALRPPIEDYQSVLQLRGPADWERSYPLPHRFYPTTQWQVGEVICTPYALRATDDMPAGIYHLSVNLADQAGQLVDAEGVLLTEVQVGRPQRLFDIPPMQHTMVQDFGGVARLLGYDWDADILKLTLYWQAQNEAPIPVNYTVFTHLLDLSGRVVAQHDGWPASGACPTVTWVQDEIVVDEHVLTFTVPDFEGRGQIEIGLYDQATGARLPLPDGSDRALLPAQVIIRQ